MLLISFFRSHPESFKNLHFGLEIILKMIRKRFQQEIILKMIRKRSQLEIILKMIRKRFQLIIVRLSSLFPTRYYLPVNSCHMREIGYMVQLTVNSTFSHTLFVEIFARINFREKTAGRFCKNLSLIFLFAKVKKSVLIFAQLRANRGFVRKCAKICPRENFYELVSFTSLIDISDE